MEEEAGPKRDQRAPWGGSQATQSWAAAWTGRGTRRAVSTARLNTHGFWEGVMNSTQGMLRKAKGHIPIQASLTHCTPSPCPPVRA